MKAPPAFQFYPADYLADEKVQVMTLQQEGIYIRLLCYCWRQGSIPNEIASIQRLCCKGEPISEDDWDAVASCFQPHPELLDRLVHPRLDQERERQAVWRAKCSKGGKESMLKRWNKREAGRRKVDKSNQQLTSDKGSLTGRLEGSLTGRLQIAAPSPKASPQVLESPTVNDDKGSVTLHSSPCSILPAYAGAQRSKSGAEKTKSTGYSDEKERKRREIIGGWRARWLKVHGSPYAFQANGDGTGSKSLAAMDETPAEILDVAEAAWRLNGSHPYEKRLAQSMRTFALNFNTIRLAATSLVPRKVESTQQPKSKDEAW